MLSSNISEYSSNSYIEFKIFIEFFIETFLILIVIQIVSDKIDNNNINVLNDLKLSLIIATILYIARSINNDLNSNIRQGFAYAISTVFLAKYNIL